LPGEKKRKFLSTGIYIKPDEWDNKNRKVKKIIPTMLRLIGLFKIPPSPPACYNFFFSLFLNICIIIKILYVHLPHVPN
jgi:hypothetical protein